jgi:CcmD family protein
MKNLLIQAQQDTAAVVDTLTKSYSQKWEAAKDMEEAGVIIQTMASNDLIFVVLAVSLIIWFVLLFYLIRLDKKVTKLEEQVELKTLEKNHET